MLSRIDIKQAIASGQLFVDGLKDGAIQPASIDLHLGGGFIQSIDRGWPSLVNPYSKESIDEAFRVADVVNNHFILSPGEFVLAATERVSIGNELVAQVAGKSSLARLGLIIESAGYIDPGFNGCITLELFNQSPNSILLTPSMPIAQIAISRLDTPADVGYVGKYNQSEGPVASMFWKNKRPEGSV